MHPWGTYELNSQYTGSGKCPDCERYFQRLHLHNCPCPGDWEERQREMKHKERAALEAKQHKAGEEKEARRAKVRALLDAKTAQAVSLARAEWEEQTEAMRASAHRSSEKLQVSLREARADLDKARHQCLALEATVRLGWTELALAQKETKTLRAELEAAHAEAAQRKSTKRQILELLNSDEGGFNAPRTPAAFASPSNSVKFGVAAPGRGDVFGGAAAAAGQKRARVASPFCTEEAE